MRRNQVTRMLFQLMMLIAFAASSSQAQAPNALEISYTVSMPKPWTHLFEVEMRVQAPANLNVPHETDLIMPVWTPGAYLIQEFERNVQDFTADANGRALDWEKVNKDTWRIKTNSAQQWRVTYRVYANELSGRTSELNSEHAFWNNAALLMYPNGSLNNPSTLRVIPAPGWKVATGLPPVNAEVGPPNVFRADNFDLLYDSPVEASNFKEIDFQVGNKLHRIVIDGEGNYDPQRMKTGVQRMVETVAGVFGSTPYHDYTFILHLRASTYFGVEHLNSTAIGFQRFNFATERGWQSFYGLVGHEFFHLWNVKRIRPDVLGPFDYTKENYTRNLWVAEGITQYYGTLMVRRAGLSSDRDYLDGLARRIQIYQNTPGRLEMSAEDASFNAWIKELRPDENSVNSQISYYRKGELLGLLLDLQIRQRTQNGKSLDDVMRYLYHEFYEKNRNYTPADFQKACEVMAGASLENFFALYVRGVKELPYNEILAAAGLRLEQAGLAVGTDNPDRPVALKAYLGADLEDSNGFVSVRSVRAGSPAYEQGLNAKDLIIALDGARVNKDLFDSLIAGKKPGDVARLTLIRDDNLRTLEIKVGGHNDAAYLITRLPSLSDQQKRIYESWLQVQNR